MSSISPDLQKRFPSLSKWPASSSQHIQLYTLATPNGVKASIMLEELGLPYDAHKIDISKGEQFWPEFLSIAPNNKIPALLDLNGPDGAPIALFESGAILVYLAEKTNRFLSTNPVLRYQTLQWLMWQVGGLGPMLGQLGFFHKFAGSQWEDKRPLERYTAEAQRLLRVLNQHLENREWMVGNDYSIADIAIFPWVRNLIGFYAAADLVEFKNYPHIARVLDNFLARPAVQKGLLVPEAR